MIYDLFYCLLPFEWIKELYAQFSKSTEPLESHRSEIFHTDQMLVEKETLTQLWTAKQEKYNISNNTFIIFNRDVKNGPKVKELN